MTIEEIRGRAETYLSLEENPVFRDEIRALLDAENWDELSDRFWRDLDFGTGGLRGIIGGGSNRINTHVIRKATQGLAKYILAHFPASEAKVVIAFDSRRYSDLFAEEAARVLAANAIRTWIFPSLRPTPVLSFAVRRLGACAGIMVTASHNPAKYNGYKVFWSDGAQVVPPHDKGIMAEVGKVTGSVKALNRQEAGDLIGEVGEEIDQLYRQELIGQALNPDLIKERGSSLSVVYTPLHGAGMVPVETVFTDLGFQISTVPEQRNPDGNFPTVDFPNPEIAPALEMALALGKKKNADLVMATDPDADRLGIAVPSDGDWTLITGNQLGALLTDYIFRTRKEQGRLPAHPAFVNTIVTSEFQNRIAESYGATGFRVLTGFKYIGEKIRQFEAENHYTFVFGGEESYGYLVGTAVRDKDAVSAAAMTAEMALWNLSRDRSVMDHLRELWVRFGYWQETQISRDLEGQQGQEIMKSLMRSFRENTPQEIASIAVLSLRDYRDGSTKTMEDGKEVKDILLPSSDVLQFVLEGGGVLTVRPSGTEPKIKFYVSCRSEISDNLAAARAELDRTFENISSWVNRRIAAMGG